LIDDLLGLSRLGRAHLKLEPLEMRTLVDEVIASLPPPENGCAIEWEIGELPGARGDAGLIRQVWTNLMRNAAKYSRSREPAQIRIGGYVDDTADHRLVYFVADNGVGFDMKYREKLFGVFQRLHSNEEFEGTGIGLANVHRIVNRHGGQVWAEGAVDEGSTFYFSLRNS
jgi:light-regulated signal transduction histidine kinase (bacteriophytochrome)